jgi:hypothetical protein
MTNYEKELQTMTTDKYMWLLYQSTGCQDCPANEICDTYNKAESYIKCLKRIKQWLESKAEE